VVLVQYADGFGGTGLAQTYKEFVDRGGALMYSQENIANARATLNAIYNTTAFTPTNILTRVDVNNAPIAALQGTPAYENSQIINGPFTGSVNIRALGNDAAGYTCQIDMATLTSVIPNVEIIATYTYSSVTRAYMFYDSSKGFLYCADNGWLASGQNGATNSPVTANAANGYFPASKSWSAAPGGSVQNAYIFCNYLNVAAAYAARHRDHSGDATW
jgi:hypothetical protein